MDNSIIPIIHRAINIIIFLFKFYYFMLARLENAKKSFPMMEFLAYVYPWIKALHVISVIAWMAGLLYLPRLFVYHAESVEIGSSSDKLFQTMEHRLLRAIMNPAMIAAWLFGLMLMLTPGVVDWGAIWPWMKGSCIIAMTWFHHWLGKRRKEFISGTNTCTGRKYRLMNELPTLLMIVIVISVVARPV